MKQIRRSHCDEVIGIPKGSLTHYIGSLSHRKIDELNSALRVPLDLE